MTQDLQNAGRGFQHELNNGNLNNAELTWSRNLLMSMLQVVNDRLGVSKDSHIVSADDLKKLEDDAQQVVSDAQELSKTDATR